MKKKLWTYIIYAYLLIPILIFVVGWLKWYFAIPVAVAVGYAYIRGANDDCTVYQDVFRKDSICKLLCAFIVILFWVYLSGIGGMCYQNTDHSCRTGVLRALIESEWPVVSADGRRGLVYYLGFWLPSAVVGKMFGFDAGHAFQVIWAALGIFIVYVLLCVWRKKVDLWPLFILVFFSGLDYVGWWLLNPSAGEFPVTLHLEWWATDFQFSSMTTQLFWVFNQSIPAWVATMLIVLNAEDKNRRNMFLVLSTILLTSTFPFVGLIPFVLYFSIKGFDFEKKSVMEIISHQNLIGVFVIGLISFLYLVGNGSAGSITNDSIATADSISAWTGLLSYILFYFFEFGIYAIVIHKYEKNNWLYYLVVGVLLVCPLIKVGRAHDFCMRASIPALFILMLFVIRSLEKALEEKSKHAIVIALIFMLGAITPFNEIHRTIYYTISLTNEGRDVTYPESTPAEILTYDNFSGYTDSFFLYYLAK